MAHNITITMGMPGLEVEAYDEYHTRSNYLNGQNNYQYGCSVLNRK